MAEWAVELDRQCRQLLRAGHRLTTDLAAVTLIDDAGLRVLKRLAAEGVGIVNAALILDDLLRNGLEP